MPAITLTLLAGDRAGAARTFDQEYVLIGRHPQADFSFPPEGELVVSSRHAALVRRDALYVVRDLGSTNGTFLNGQRLEGDKVLADGDTITLGARGPSLRFRYAREGGTGGPATVLETAIAFEPGAPPRRPASPAPPSGPGPMTPRQPPRPGPRVIVMPDGGTDTRINRAVIRHTSRLRWLLLALLAAVLLGGAAVMWWNARRARALAEEQQVLLAQMDSLLVRIRAVADSNAAVRAEVRRSTDEATRLRELVAESRVSAQELTALRDEVQRASRRSAGLAAAADVDAREARRALAPMMAALLIDADRGTSAGGAIAAGGAGGQRVYLVPARAVRGLGGTPLDQVVLLEPGGRRRSGIVIAQHPTLPLAVVRVPEAPLEAPGLDAPAGGEPPAPGTPVVIVGPDGEAILGAVGRSRPDAMQLDVFGGKVERGSAVATPAGRVIGIVAELEPSSGGRIAFAVPTAGLRPFLADAAER